MPRFYLPPSQCDADDLVLTGAEAHHASRVLRLRPGDSVTVLDGAGHEYSCTLQDVAPDAVRMTLVERRSIPPLPSQITLLQAVPKGKLMEWIIEKATELGASRIVPILSERVVVHLDRQDAAHKQQRWQQAAIEAIKQCGSAWLPAVETPVTPEQFLSRQERFVLPLVASLRPESKHPREYFQTFSAEHHHKPESICIWVGPEGDFTPAEYEMIQAAGARPVTLGSLVLRAETAALYCLSILRYEAS